MEENHHLEILDEAIKASETNIIKEILQETKDKFDNTNSKDTTNSEFVYFETIQDIEELVKNYYKIVELEQMLYPYFDLQGQIEEEAIQPTENEKQHLHNIIHQASSISGEISQYLNTIFKERPTALTSRGFKFIEIFKSIQ